MKPINISGRSITINIPIDEEVMKELKPYLAGDLSTSEKMLTVLYEIRDLIRRK